MRLSRRRDIKKVLASAKSFSSRIGRVVSSPGAGNHGRILFVISAKTVKKSSGRSRIRRQLSELTRRHYAGKNLSRDVVIFVSPLAAGMTGRNLQVAATETLNQIDALARKS